MGTRDLRWVVVIGTAACSPSRHLPPEPVPLHDAERLTMYATLPGEHQLVEWTSVRARVCDHCPGATAEFAGVVHRDGLHVYLSAYLDASDGLFLYAREATTRLGRWRQVRHGYQAGEAPRPGLDIERDDGEGESESVRRGAIVLRSSAGRDGDGKFEARFWLAFPAGVVEGYVVGRPDWDAGFE